MDALDASDFELEQCTGLKDVNGNDIYEGDIVHFKYNSNEFYVPVVFKNGKFTGNCKIIPDVRLTSVSVGSGYHFLGSRDYYYSDIYIAGNVHENPELLEADK